MATGSQLDSYNKQQVQIFRPKHDFEIKVDIHFKAVIWHMDTSLVMKVAINDIHDGTTEHWCRIKNPTIQQNLSLFLFLSYFVFLKGVDILKKEKDALAIRWSRQVRILNFLTFSRYWWGRFNPTTQFPCSGIFMDTFQNYGPPCNTWPSGVCIY